MKLLILSLVLALLPSASRAATLKIESGTGRAAADLFLPDNVHEKRSWPIVLMLHGYIGDSSIMETWFGLQKQVTKRGFILVVPNGNKDSKDRQFWNASPACCDFDHTNPDDVAYLMELVAGVQKDYGVPGRNLIVIGHSNGGFMAHRLACDHSEIVKGIVSFAGVGPLNPSDCHAQQPVAMLQIHAVDDDTILFNGDKGYPGLTPYPGAEATVAQWVSRNGCSSATVSGADLDLTSSIPGADTATKEWSGCAARTAFWKIKAYKSWLHFPHTPLLRDEFTDRVLDFALGNL